jgi:Flp pilus assembly protein TadD
MKNNDPSKAVVLLKKAVELKPDLRMAHADLGVIYMDQKRYPEAATALQRAIHLDPAQPDAHYRLGRLYRATGDAKAAQREFTTVQKLHKKAEDDVLEKMSGAPPPLQP